MRDAWSYLLMLSFFSACTPSLTHFQPPAKPTSENWGMAANGPCEARWYKGKSDRPTRRIEWVRTEGRIAERLEYPGVSEEAPVRRITYRYDPISKRLVEMVTREKQDTLPEWTYASIRYRYAPNGHLTEVAQHSETGQLIRQAKMQNNADGQPVLRRSSQDGALISTEQYEYGPDGRMQTHTYFSADSEKPLWTRVLSYDAQKRLSQIQHSRDGLMRYLWDEQANRVMEWSHFGAKTGEPLATVRYDYDESGQLVQESWERNVWPRPMLERIKYRYDCE